MIQENIQHVHSEQELGIGQDIDEIDHFYDVLPGAKKAPWNRVWQNNYPRPIRVVGYCLALRRLSVPISLPLHLQPTIFHGSCLYLVQPLTLVVAWTLLIMGFLCLFSGILWDFEILRILTYLLLGLGQPRVAVLLTVFVSSVIYKTRINDL